MMTSKHLDEFQVVRQSEIRPEIMQSFISGYIREHANRNPYNYSDEMEQLYPDFEKWFRNKVEPNLSSVKASRELLLLMAPNSPETEQIVAGFAILKKTVEEKKICTFRISNGWRKKGAGRILMNACFKHLGTTKPLFTVSDKCKASFESLIKEYNFQLTEQLENYYANGSVEFVYNGVLKK